MNDNAPFQQRLSQFCFTFCLVMGVCVLLITLIMITTSPLQLSWSPAGLTTPILAFEFINSLEEARRLFGPEKIGLNNLINCVHWDAAYLVCYSLFLASFAIGGWAKTGNKNLILCVFFAFCAGVCDFFENQILLAIGREIAQGVSNTANTNLDFSLLRTLVNAKFTAIAMVLTLLFPFISTHKEQFPKSFKLYTFAACIALLSSLGIWFSRWVLPEVLAFSIAICWVVIGLTAYRMNPKRDHTA